MKYCIFTISLLLWQIDGFSQIVTVIDANSGEPIEGAVLLSEVPQASLVTNALGQADITALKTSTDIYIRSLGYKTLRASFSTIQYGKFIVRLERSELQLDQVVISGTKWQQSSDKVPSKIITINPSDVALQNPQTAADLLGISGKVFIQKSQQGGGSPMIRGFATNRLIYTIDGVRMNTAIFRGGNIQNVINLDPWAIEKTEVLFGPGSVIYGSDAIGGAMGFHTLTPQLSLNEQILVTGKANTRYSSASSERSAHFDVNAGGRKWAVLTSFSSWDYDHLRQGSNGPEDYIKDRYVQRQDSLDVVVSQEDRLLQIPSAYSQLNFMQKIRFRPNERWDLQYALHYSTTSPYGRYDRHNRIRNGNLRYAEWDYGPQSWLMHYLSVTHQKQTRLFDQLSMRFAWQSFEESRISRDLNDPERTTQTEHVEAYSANIDFSKSTGWRNELFYGLEAVVNDVNSTGLLSDISTGLEENGPSRYPEATWQSVAAYISNEYEWSETFTIQGGVRYNLFALDADFSRNTPFYPLPFTEASLSNGALTGSLGGIYRPAENWVFRANIGTAFRAPNVDDIGKVFDSEPGAVTVPNPDLRAEHAWNGDIGLARVFGEYLKVDVSAYYTLLNNAMVRRDFQLNGQDSILYEGEQSGVQAIQNAAQARVYGLQAGMELKFIGGLSLLSDYNMQWGEEEMDDGSISPSRHAAPSFGVTRIRFRDEDLTIEWYAMYQGEVSHEKLAVEERSKDEIYAKDANGNNFAPAWYTLNIKASIKVLNYFTIGAGLENITDQRYRPYSSGISGAGRNFLVSLQAEF